MSYGWHDFIGNVGLVLLLGAYLLLQLGKIKSEDLAYSLLNALAAACLVVSLCFEFNMSAFLVEFFWLLISLFGIFKRKRPRRA